MKDRFSSVLEIWGMACPNCRADHMIDITATVAVRLTLDGSDADEAEDGSHLWSADSRAVCQACLYSGTVNDFTV